MYEVESIVNKRVNPITKMSEYEVKWTGYSSKETTWEPERNLVFVRELIDKFNERTTIGGEPSHDVHPPEQRSGGILGKEIEKVEQIKRPQNLYSTARFDSEDEEDYLSKFSQAYQEPDDYFDCPNGEMLSLSRPAGPRDPLMAQSQALQDSRGHPLPQSEAPMRQTAQSESQLWRESAGGDQAEGVGLPQKSGLQAEEITQKQNSSQYLDLGDQSSPIKYEAQFHKERIKNGIKKQGLPKTKRVNKNPRASQTNERKRGEGTGQGGGLPLLGHEPQNDMIDLLSMGYKAPDTFPTYRKETFNQLYGLHRKPIQYESSMGRRRKYPEKALYSGYDSSFQGFPSPYNLPISSFKTESMKEENEPLGYRPYQEEEPQYSYQGGNESQSYLGSYSPLEGHYGGGEMVVYEVVHMVKRDTGLCYLAQTSQGEIWLPRHEIVPKYSTELCKFYENNIVFDDSSHA